MAPLHDVYMKIHGNYKYETLKQNLTAHLLNGHLVNIRHFQHIFGDTYRDHGPDHDSPLFPPPPLMYKWLERPSFPYFPVFLVCSFYQWEVSGKKALLSAATHLTSRKSPTAHLLIWKPHGPSPRSHHTHLIKCAKAFSGPPFSLYLFLIRIQFLKNYFFKCNDLLSLCLEKTCSFFFLFKVFLHSLSPFSFYFQICLQLTPKNIEYLKNSFKQKNVSKALASF